MLFFSLKNGGRSGVFIGLFGPRTLRLKTGFRIRVLKLLISLFGFLAFAPQSIGSPSYTIQELGLTGTAYEYSASGGIVQDTPTQSTNSDGEAAGLTDRYDSAGDSLGQDAWFFNGTETLEIGPTGPVYSYAVAGGNYEASNLWGFNSIGQVLGETARFTSTGGGLGSDDWIYDNGSITAVGLTGGIYSFGTTEGTAQESIPRQLNDSGDATGISYRFDGSGDTQGFDAWYFNGTSTQQIGLAGPTYGASGGAYASSEPQSLNNAGQVVGYSDRYSNSNSLGEDVWFFDGTATHQIGLVGGVYSFVGSNGLVEQSTLVQTIGPGGGIQLNATGSVIGYSSRYSSINGSTLGQDGWIYSNGVTQQIGLTGGVYSAVTSKGTAEESTPQQINSSGEAIGYSARYLNNSSVAGGSQDAWIFNGTSTQLIGLTGSLYGTPSSNQSSEYSAAVQLNDAGQVIGDTGRGTFFEGSSTLGYDSWYFNGTSTQQIGLTGGAYSYFNRVDGGTYESSAPAYLNKSGQVMGTSARFDSDGNSLGRDAWFFNGSSTQQIGLYGGADSYASPNGTLESSTPTQLNSSGQVLGYSDRYDSAGNSLGQDGWFFDPATGITTPLEFSVDSANGYSYTDPIALTDNGVVLGDYTLYGGSTDLGNRVFYWSEADGFHDLGSLVAGGLASENWQFLSDVDADVGPTENGSPSFISGIGEVSGQTGGQSFYLLTSVPEPTACSFLLIGFAISTMRPRRAT